MVGSHYFNHGKIDALFERAGAPGSPPEGSCITKSTVWLRRSSDDPATDALSVLGAVLEPIMGYVAEGARETAEIENRQSRVLRVIEKNGLAYSAGEVICDHVMSYSSFNLLALLGEYDLPNVEVEFERAIANLEADPPAAVCAACAGVEALLKAYIEDENLKMPKRATLKELWKVARKEMRQDPGQVEDDDVSRILSGQTSIIDGIASLRTHASSAHGQGRNGYKVDYALAEYVVTAAHGFAVFQLRRWLGRRPKGGKARRPMVRSSAEVVTSRTLVPKPNRRRLQSA